MLPLYPEVIVQLVLYLLYERQNKFELIQAYFLEDNFHQFSNYVCILCFHKTSEYRTMIYAFSVRNKLQTFPIKNVKVTFIVNSILLFEFSWLH